MGASQYSLSKTNIDSCLMLLRLAIASIFSTIANELPPLATDAVLQRTRQCELGSIARTSISNATRHAFPVPIYDISFLLDEIELLEIRL